MFHLLAQVFWEKEKTWATATIQNVNIEEKSVIVEYKFGQLVTLWEFEGQLLRFPR